MFMKLDLINSRGMALPISDNDDFYISNIDGMTKADSSISSVVLGGFDGDIVNNIQAQPRTIIIDLTIKRNADVESTKRKILNIVKLKQTVSLLWEQNNKQVSIDGIVESVAMPRWNDGVVMQISLHCAEPFWADANELVTQISEAISLHYFTAEENNMLFFTEDGAPFGEIDMSRTRNINNAGDVETGMDIEILACDTVTNPILYGADGAYFGIGYGDGNRKVIMQKGDIVNISTYKGNKFVTLNGTSIMNKIKAGSTWLQLNAGVNVFSIASDDDKINNMTFSMSYKQLYI